MNVPIVFSCDGEIVWTVKVGELPFLPRVDESMFFLDEKGGDVVYTVEEVGYIVNSRKDLIRVEIALC
jgi:hypothetical protein